eukprot:evm.model.scf_754.6 EVM.evm.TU.scf_754.6   scf_754:54352-58915(+)
MATSSCDLAHLERGMDGEGGLGGWHGLSSREGEKGGGLFLRCRSVRKEVTFQVDVSALETSYKKLQMLLHPDRFSNRSSKEQEHAGSQSALIGHGYKTLKSPLKRAEYLLQLHGYPKKEGTIDDPEILMEVMEVQEAVAEATDPSDLKELQIQNQQKQQEVIHAMSDAFKTGDMATVETRVAELAYLTRIGEHILNKL